MSDVWDEHWTGPTKTLDVHIAALRAQITEVAEQLEGQLGQAPDLPTLTTLRGFGYRLEAPASQSPVPGAPDSASAQHQ
jgi:DNA-binding response OmpR family regulator